MSEKRNSLSQVEYVAEMVPSENQALIGRTDLILQNDMSKREGISVPIATIYIIGFVAGSGLIALPKVIFGAGWYGIISLPILVLIGYFTALALCKCWNIIYKNYPEYRQHVRHPYVVIGYIAFGKFGAFVMHVVCMMMFFAVSLVMLLLITDNIRLVTIQWFDISFCSWIPIVTLILYPIVLLKTPVETQFFAVLSALSSFVMFCLILVQIVHDGEHVDVTLREQKPEVTFTTITIAWSTIGFSASGHACFPLYQNSMREPIKFNYSLIAGFLGIFLLLGTPSYFSYHFLGTAVYTSESDNLLNVLSDGLIKSLAGLTLAIHFMMSYVFTLNPLCQQLEEIAGIPDKFSWQLVLIRSCLVAAHLFLAESLPQFGPLLSLVGACLWMPSAYIAPSIFYLRLRHLTSKSNNVLDSTLIHMLIIVFAGVIVCCSTYTSLLAFISDQSSFSVPCYINSTAAHI